MALPAVPELLQDVMAAEWFMKYDNVSFLYQFPLNQEVSKFFCFRVDSAEYVFRVLPMGWKYAPLIAQGGCRGSC